MSYNFGYIKSFNGELVLPGDKSISHRSVMFSSLAEGKSKISNCLDSEDLISTMNCFRALGCDIVKAGTEITVEGRGFLGFKKPEGVLDAGNSGTTARLISGILAAQKVETILTGDESLCKRPMSRVALPLTQMGAKIELAEGNTLPGRFIPVDTLKAIEYKLPVASAQIKSAVLLAGLFLEDETVIIESVKCRDHTERMLRLPQEDVNGTRFIKSSKQFYPGASEYVVPSDISTAAFFIVAALLGKDSEVVMRNISLNETRTGIIDVLRKMGGSITIENEKTAAGEPYGDLVVKSSNLKNIEIDEDIIPNIIDEIPVLSVAGLFAEGDFTVKHAKELRVKESDRIHSLCENYKKLGIEIEEYEDGFALSGEIKNTGTQTFESYGDHRIAMAFAVLSTQLEQGGNVENFQSAAISNPKFVEQLNSIAG